MAQQDRYGLSATFEFDDGDSLAKIQKSINQLNQLQQQIDQFRQQQSRTVSVVGSVAQQVGRANQQAANTINRFNRPNQQLKNQLQSIAKEFRAIKAEARNIDFGDLHDTRAFESGRQSIARYVSELKALESQIAGVSAEERILTANLKRQQKVMEDRVSVAANQRTAAIAQQRMGVAGGVATAGAAALLPLVSVGKEAINTVASFDDQIAQARAVSGASIEESNRIRERAKQLGAETKFSASQAASAFVLLGQAGYNADQQLKAIDGTLMLAAAGGIDLATATDIAVSTMGGFNAKAEEAIHYSNVLAQTANAANLGVADLGETMKYVAPAAKAYGASVEQAAAMAGVLSNAGIKGTQAGTSLRAMFLRLSAPTKAASGQLRQYGIDVSDSSGHLRQLPELLGEMNTALKDVDDARKMEFVKKVFGTEASSAVLNLMANLKDVRDLTKQNIVSSVAFEGLGVAAYQAGVMEDNLAGAFRSFLSALEGVTIEIGDFLKVAVRPLVDAMTSLMRGFLNLPKPVKNLAIGVGVLLTGLSALAAVGGAIAVAFFWLQSAVATAAIGLTTMASAGLPLTGFFATVMNAFAGQGLVAGFAALGSAMGGVATSMLSIAGGMSAWLLLFGFVQAFFVRLNLLGTALSKVASIVGFFAGAVKGVFAGVAEAFSPVFYETKALLESFFPVVKGVGYLESALKMATDAFKDFFKVGVSVGSSVGLVVGSFLVIPLRVAVGILRVIARMLNSDIARSFSLIKTSVSQIFGGLQELFVILWKMKNAGGDVFGVFKRIGLAFASIKAIGLIALGVKNLASAFGVSTESVSLLFKAVDRVIKKVLSFLGYAQKKTTWLSGLIGEIASLISVIQTIFSVIGKITKVIQSIDDVFNKVSKKGESIASAFVRSSVHIKSAWQGFVDWFAEMPLVESALAIAKGLINALNHNPTVKIPLAWEDARDRISATLDELLAYSRQIGNQLSDALINAIPSFDDAKGFLFSIDLDINLTRIKEVPSLIGSYLLKIRDAILAAIKSGIEQVPTLIQSYLPKINNAVTSALSLAASRIPSSFDEVKKSLILLSRPLSTASDQVKEFLGDTILANSRVSAAFYETLSFVDKVATGFKNKVITPVWQFLSAIIQQVADFESRTGFFEGVFGRIQNSFLRLRSVIVTGWQEITVFFQRYKQSVIDSVTSTIGSAKSLGRLLKGTVIVLSQLLVVLAGIIGFARGISSGFLSGLLHPILKLLERIGGASDLLQSKTSALARLFSHLKDAFLSLETVGRAIGQILAIPAAFALNVVLTMLSALDLFIESVLPFFRLIANIFSGVGSVFQSLGGIPFPFIALGALSVVIAIDKAIKKIELLAKAVVSSAQKSKTIKDIFVLMFVDLLQYIGKMRRQIIKLFKGFAIQSKGLGNFAQGVVRVAKSLSDIGAEITGLTTKILSLSMKILPKTLAALRLLQRMDMSGFRGEIKEITDLIGKNTKNIIFRIKRIIRSIHQVGVAVRQTIRGVRDIVVGSVRAGSALSKIFDNSQGQLDHLIVRFRKLVKRISIHFRILARNTRRSIIGQSLENAANAAAAKWTIATTSIYLDMKRMVRRGQALVRLLSRRMSGTPIGQVIGQSLENAANAAAAKWTIALDSIYVRMKRLSRRAQAIGRLLVKRLSENSPGPTFQIRQKWTQTTESIQGQMSELAIHASKAGKKMAAALGKGATDRLSKLSGGFSQAGSLLSNFAPSLAAPLFVVGDLLDTIDLAKDGLPGLKKGFTAVKAATSGAAKEFGRVATAIPGVLQGVTDVKDVFPGLAQGFARLKDFKLTKPDWSQWKSSASETFTMVGAAWVDVSGNVMDLARNNGLALKKSFSGFKAKSGKMLEQAKGHLSTLKSSTTQLVKTGVAGFSGWIGSVGEMRHELAGLRASTVSFAKSGLKGFSRWINTIPELTSLMSFFGWTSAAANTAQAATSASASAATATQTAVTVSGTAAMSTGFAGLAAAARSAWVSTVAPLLPVVGQFLAVAAAIGAVLGVIKLIAPNFNALAAIIRPLSYLMGFLYGVVEGLLSPFFDLTKILRGVYDAVRNFIFPAFTLTIRPIESLANYLYEVGDAFLSSFGSGASLGRSLGVLISKVLLAPLRLVGAVLRGIGKLIARVFTSIGSAIISAVTAPVYFVISAFQGAVEQIRAAWQGFVDWFKAMPLVKFAGGIAQGLIDALNHNPTVKIPIAWEEARDRIQGSIAGLVPQAETVASDLVGAFSDRAGQLAATLQQSLGGGVESPTVAPGAPIPITTDPRPAVWGLDKVKSVAVETGRQLQQSLGNFVDVRPAEQLHSVMQSVKTAVQGASDSMKGLLLSTIAAGVTALAGLSPVVLVVGGLALVAGAVATNFLGARTILKGLGQVATGSIEMAIAVFDGLVATVKMTISVISGIAQAIGGIPSAIRGDFSQVQSGLDQVGSSFRAGFVMIGAAGDRLAGGLRTVFGGLSTIGQGFGEAIGQIKAAIGGTINFAATLPERIGAIADQLVAGWRSMVQTLGGLVPAINWSRFDSLPAWLGGIGDRLIGAWRSVASVIGGVLFSPDLSPVERARSVVAGAGESIQSAWRSAVGFVAGLPLTAAWDTLRELPVRVGAIADSLKAAWQGVIDFINNLIPQVDLSHLLALPDRVGSVMVGIKQSVVSTAEGLAAPFVAAVDKIVGLWQGLTDKIAAPLSALVEKAKGFGLGLIRNLSENSPGPTFQIRQKWMATTEAIAGQLTGLTAHAKTAGSQIATGLGDKAAGKLSKLSGGFTQAGVLLSNFAPGLAAPLFVVNDVLDTIGMAQENLPALKKGFATLKGKAAGLTGVLPSVATSLMGVGTSVMAAIAPILSFIGIAAAIGGAVFLLYKAFQSNFLGIRDVVSGVVNWLRSTFSFLSASFAVLLSPITGAVDKIKGAWSGFKGWFGDLTASLPGMGQEAGQGLIDALNHNPTVKIPIAWEEARDRIQGSIAGLVPQAETVAGDLVGAFSDRAGQLAATLQQSFGGGIDSPTISPATPGAPVQLSVDPQPAVGALQKLKTTATQTGEQLRQSLSNVVNTQPVDQLRSAMQSVKTAAEKAGDSMKGLLLSTIATGLAALAGLSPVVLVVGGLALVAGAVATNFLGARTILKGLGQVATGSIKMAIAVFDGLAATVKMVIGVISGIAQAIGGIPSAIRGDFSQVQVGLDQVGSSFRAGFMMIGAAGDRMAAGLRTIFGGLSTIGQGFGEAIGQIKAAIGGTINFAATLPERLGAIADQLVAVWHVGVQQIGRIIPSVDWSRFDGLPAWLGGISDRLISAWRTVSTTIAGVLLRPDLSLIERAQSVMTAASDAIGSAWRSVVVLVAGLPLVGDGSGLERLKGLAQSVADGIGSIWRGLTGMIGSLPLVPDGSGFERARAIAQSAGDAIQSGWRGLVGWLSSQPLTVDGSAFERARGLVSGASESIQSVWRSLTTFVSGLPLAVTWDTIRQLPERIGAITDSLQVTWQSTVAFINNLIPQVDLSHLLSLPDRVGSVMADIKQSVVSTAEGLAAPFVAAVDKIVGLWQGLTDKITAPLSELVEKAKGFGLGLIRNLSENSPGPTFQIRQKWMATTEAITGQLTGLTAHAKTAGAQIATGLGDKAAGKLSKLSGGFTQAGVLLSNFAPGLAAPLFVVNDVLDTIGMAQENLPALKDGFSKLTGVTAQLPQRLGAIGSGLLSIAGTGLSTLSAAITPALASIGTAATAAWSSLIAPLLPFIAIAAGVVLAIVLIRKAFKSNFLGLRDIVDRVMGAIASAGVWVAAPFQMIGKTITGAIDKLSAGWDRVKSLVGGVLGFLPRAAKETGGQLVDALNHNPTVKIPLAWEAAGGQISQTMTGLVDRATVVASDLTDRLTLAPQITPEVISPTNATTPLATPGAIAVPVEVTGTRQLDQVKATIQTVSQSAGQFARNTMAAIGSLPQWGQKAQDAIASVAGQFGWATAGAIGFGVTALAGLSPVVLVAGALALAAGAVMSNFLGARTIVKGLGQVASGSIEIAIAVFDGLAATVKMVVGTIKGIVQAIGGIPAALRGDFSQVQAGLDQVGASFKSGFAAIGAAGDRLIGGLRTVFDGLSTIGRGFLEAVDQISAAVRGLPGLAGETFTSIGARVDGLRQSLSNAADAIVAPFVGAIEKIGALWSGLTDRVSGFFGKLTGKAQSTGQQLVSALAENSPGPTFQIRQKWAATTEAIGGHLSELVAKGKKTGGQLAASLGDKVAGKLGKISGGFTQIGVLLSNVSPALAAPFFLMNDILDSAGMVAENLPALQKGLSKVGVIAGKLPGMLGGLGATLGSLGSSLLTLAVPVVTAIGSSLVPIFGAVATAAGTAWSAVIAPALPFVGIAAAIVGAVWLIKKAFDTNFLGIRDLITNVFKAIGAVGAWLLTPFRAIGNAVQGAIALIRGGWQQVKGVVSGVLGFLPGLAMKAGNGLVNALNHNPTVRIPIAWDEARTQVTGSIQSMVPVAESAGTQMSAALSSQPVIQPIVATPTGSGEAALPTATQTVQQQVAAPASGASFLAPITAGVAGVTAQFDQMRSAATGAIGSAIDGVGKLSSGFVQLAVAALPSLLPIGLALAGIALAAAAIATNFLGVRTIVSAVFDAIRGAIEGVRQVFSGMAQIVQGVINVFQGLGAALTGDWSLVQVGLTQIRSGFQYVFGGLGAIIQSGVGLAKGVLTGFGQAVRQVWSVVKQFLGPVGDLIEGIFDRIGATIRDVMSRIELLTSKLAGVGQAIANSPFGKLFGGGKNAAAAMPEPEAKQGGWWTKLGGDKTDEPSAAVKTADEIATDRINSAQTALSSLGSIASVIAPQLAGPIGAVSSLFDGFIGLAGVLPQISSAMSFFGFTASAANTAQSVTAGAAAGATATQTGVTVTGTAAMATGFTGLAAAAGTAWAAITGPLLPIIAGIAIIGAVIWAVSKNVWGLGDAFRAAWRVTIEPFWRAFYEAGASIRAAFISLGQAISEIFGIRAVGPLNLFGKLAAGIFTVLLLPIRILAIAVGGLIKLIGGVIAAAIYGIATLARIVFWPVSMVLRGVEAIRVAVWAVVNGIANLLLRPFDAIGVIIRFVGSAIGAVIGGVAAMGRMIWSVIQPIAGWMVSLLGGIFAGPLQILKSGISAVMSMFTGMASGVQSAFAMVTGAIGSAFSMIWTLIPAPLRWILEQASKGIGWLMSAVTGGGQPQGTLEPQRFAVGGLVKGPGGPTGDRVPALLSDGEFVMNAPATANNLPFLAALNAGRTLALPSAGEFVVNAAATANNLPILAALNAGRALAQDGAPEVMPMPVPMPPVRSVGSMASGASLGNAGGREVTINLNFGGITLQGSPTEAAEQFKAEILYDEQFQRAVRDALRDLVEFSK